MPDGKRLSDCKQTCGSGKELGPDSSPGDGRDVAPPADGQVTARRLRPRKHDSVGVKSGAGASGEAAAQPGFTQDPETLPDGTPLWIKTGKWRAAMKCSVAHCISSVSIKKPISKGRSYVLVYIPESITCKWISTENLCPIDNNPTPLAAGTHESERQSVRDASIMQHGHMVMLELEIIDISDKLPKKAVIPAARTPDFWKDFARVAGKSRKHSEVGAILPRLHDTILPTCIRTNWMKTRYQEWKKACERSSSANDVEKLRKEFYDNLEWVIIDKLWSNGRQTQEETEEWATWKGAIYEDVKQRMSAAQRESEAQMQNDPGVKTAKTKRTRDPKVATGLTSINVAGCGQELVTKNELALAVAATDTENFRSSKDPSTSADVNKSGDSICTAKTRRGVPCTHKAKFGALFCGKHMPMGSVTKTLRDASVDVASSRPGHDRDTGKSLKRKRLSTSLVRNPSSLATNSHAVDSEEVKGQHPGRVNHTGICGAWVRGSTAPCSNESGYFALSCKEHERACARQPENEAIHELPIDRVTDTAIDMSTQTEQNDLQMASNLVHGYLTTAMGNQSSLPDSRTTEAIKETLVHQASQSITLAEGIQALTVQETDRLKEQPAEGKQLVDGPDSVQTCLPGDCHLSGNCSARHEESVTPANGRKFSVADDAVGESCVIVTAQQQLLSCTLCKRKFGQKKDLCSHWSSDHERQASLFTKSFACRICKFEASTASIVEEHWLQYHKGIPFDCSWFTCISCREMFCDKAGLWEHVTNMHLGQLTRQASHDIHPDTWKPFQRPARPGQQEMTWTCITSPKRVASDPGPSGFKDGDPADVPTTKTTLLTSSRMDQNAPAQQPPLHQLIQLLGVHKSRDVQSTVQWNTDKQIASCDTGLLTDVSPKPVETDENEVASRERGRGWEDGWVDRQGRKRTGWVVRQQGQGSSEAESTLPPSELLRRRQRLTLTARGQFEQQKRVTSFAGADAIQGVTGENTLGAPCRYGQNMGARSSSGDRGEQEEGEIPNRNLVEKDSQQLGNVHDVMGACGIKEENGSVKLQTSPLSSAELDVSANKADRTVLSEDISLGQEPVAVPCVVNTDVLQPCTCTLCQQRKECDTSTLRPWDDFVYTTERLLDPLLGIETKDSQVGCSCEKDCCAPELCEHVKMFDHDNVDACDVYGHPMQGRFPYDNNGRMLLEEGRLVYECNLSCLCSKGCQNRVLQNGVHVKLEVYKTRHKGWAVRAAQPITRGTFICEYIGEVLNNEEANQRGKRYDKAGCSYLYDIDAHLDTSRKRSWEGQHYVIDATARGNVSRFINHSCSPNLVNYQVLTDSMDCRLAHIGFFASSEIAVGEELAYDYRYKLLPGKGFPCHCGSTTCRGRLY